MAETRFLIDALSFGTAATAWGKTKGILDSSGTATAVFPTIIGMPPGSADLGAFNLGIIRDSRTIKQALQDLESEVSLRMFANNNLADLADRAISRTNLGLGTSSVWNVGTSGAVIPLLNTTNTWSGNQVFNGGASVASNLTVTNSGGASTSSIFINGTSRRWAITKNDDVESGTSVGSSFLISRYDNSGNLIDSPLTINRSTGVVSLSQPLPITSGGTGATSLGGLKAAIGLGNVTNTSDADKPISSAVQAALNAKMDKLGGNLSGDMYISGAVIADLGLRSRKPIIVDGETAEGGQIVLGFRGVTGLSNQGNGTWNIDVDGSNYLRIFSQSIDGVIGTSDITIRPRESVTIGHKLDVTGNGILANFSGTGTTHQGISITSRSASSSSQSIAFIDFKNESNVPVAHMFADVATDGSSSIGFGTTVPGSRTADRRGERMRLHSDRLDINVPINGHAYPRRSDGTPITFQWVGQPGQPSWVWGGGDGVTQQVYNPSNFSVNYANNSGQLVGINGGNSGGYIRRSTDSAGNGYWSRQLILAGHTPSDDVWSSPLEINEVNGVGNTNTASAYAPGILFHWRNVGGSELRYHADGSFRFQYLGSDNVIQYRDIYTNDLMTNGWLRPINDTGIYWNQHGRGMNVSTGYGNVATYGTGANGWSGYTIGTWATFMANGSEGGIYSQDFGDWLVRFDTNRDAIFPRNVRAYSDERLKHNKRPIDNIAERRKGLAHAAMMWERDGRTEIGYGAQTLESSNPEFVTTGDDPLQTKSVNYINTIAILAADNQILSDRVDELESTLASLVDRLEKAGL